MNENIRDMLPEHLSDEAAYHLVSLLYELASTVEAIYLGEIMRYKKAIDDQFNDIPDPPF